ncbi:MAG: hypothetical protein JWP57_4654 [Spirosoma sp.]|nr:hypothetical protein [Spirosoma sp.]
MKNYLALDIETTGLNPETCQILEIGAVYDNGESPIEELPRFQCFVWHPQIVGEPRALAMNQRCLEVLASVGQMNPGEIYDVRPNAVDGVLTYRFDEVGYALRDFALGASYGSRKIPVAGKNVGSFDWQFIKRLPAARQEIVWPFDFRFLDVGPLFLRPRDTAIPGQSKCLQRAGLPNEVTHCALDDALQVVQLVRAWRGGT